jgi:hypothetical protein
MQVGLAFIALIGLLGMAGCASQKVVQPIDVGAISAVQAEIKRQIGIYIAADSQVPVPSVTINGVATPVSNIENGFWCGNSSVDGHIGFDVSSIKVELVTTLDNTGGASAAFTLPADIVTVGPSGGYKRDVTNTQTLDYNLWPLEHQSRFFSQNVTEEDIQSAPIAQALLSLRDALILSSMRLDYSTSPPTPRPPQPCFTDYDPTKPASDPGDSFKLGLSITNDVTGGVSVKVTILDFSATGESKSTTGNTLTVNFLQKVATTKNIQSLRDAMDTECKYPVKDPQKCASATTNFDEVVNNPNGLAAAY